MKKTLLLFSLLGLNMVKLNAQCATTSAPTNNCGFGDRVDTYVLNGIASPNSAGCSMNGYASFAHTWTLSAGAVYSFSSAVGNNIYSQGLVIWLDANNDGSYASTEALYVGGSVSLTHSGTLQIPSGAVLNTNLRMRVKCSYGSMTSSDACLVNQNSYGETEDYYVFLTCPTLTNVNVATTNTFICQGQSATFTASANGANSFTYVGVGNGSVMTVTPSTTTNYTIIAGNSSCSSSTFSTVRTISVTNVPISVSAAATNTMLCAGFGTTLNAVGASNYTWLPGGQNNASVVVSPSANATYTLIGYNGNGCPGSATLGINVNPAPSVSVSPSSASICVGNSVTLTANGAVSYTWNNTSTLTGSSIVLTPSTSIAIQVVGASSIGCTAAANTIVLVQQAPVVNATIPATLFCQGESVTVTATGANTYTWNNNTTGNTAVYTPTGMTQISVMGMVTGSICPGTKTLMINTTQPTVVAVASPTAICVGKTATINATGADNYTYSSVFNTVNPTVTTVYTVTGEALVDNLTCSAETTVEVVVNANPTITASADRTEMCRNETTTLTATGGVSYNWTGAATGTTQSIEFKPVVAQTYSVYVKGTDANGCVSNHTMTVKVNACTGIEEVAAKLIHVYPNPNNGLVTIATESAMHVTITDINGRMVAQFALVAGENIVSLENLSNGVYFVNSDNNLREKLIINK